VLHAETSGVLAHCEPGCCPAPPQRPLRAVFPADRMGK
jgi:hypothetical protein